MHKPYRIYSQLPLTLVPTTSPHKPQLPRQRKLAKLATMEWEDEECSRGTEPIRPQAKQEMTPSLCIEPGPVVDMEDEEEKSGRKGQPRTGQRRSPTSRKPHPCTN